MPDKLKPLTEAEALRFQSWRQSDAVVQVKCSQCSAWYETPRLHVEFVETFDCDCGNRLTYTVPALDLISMATNEDVLALGDHDMRLDTGMKVSEAVTRASLWWDGKGRKLMSQSTRQADFANRSIDDPNFLPSGIVHGDPWDTLNKREKLIVTKVWHHFNVRKPDLLGDDDQANHRMQDRKSIN